jgi:hypothetical protein
MTKEEKQLLLKDLCARSYYQPFVQLNPGAYNKPEKCWICGISGEDIYLNVDSDPFSLHDFNILPYLRPMSSMTEEEKKVVCSMNMISDTELNDRLNYQRMYLQNYTIETFDYFNEHHLDYRGLIPMGLALEAAEGMYE